MTLEEALQIIQKLLDENARLRARVEELERRLGINSQNSSKPPSSDRPWQGPKRSGGKGKKRRRGWGVARKLVPLEQVDTVIELHPERCACCGKKLLAQNDAAPLRHQVVELPPVRAEVTEYRLHRGCCRRCGSQTRASLPAAVSCSAFGPRLTATVSLLGVGYRLGKRLIQSLLRTFWNVAVSLGAICGIERRMSAALRGPYDGACGHVRGAKVAYADETTWKEKHRLKWLWTVGNQEAVVFRIASSRGSAVAKELLAEFEGTLISDRYGAYLLVPWQRRQVCWAHLKRELVAMSEMKEPVSKHVGEQGLLALGALFETWHRYQNKHSSQDQFIAEAEPLGEQLVDLLQLGAQASHRWTRCKCRSILKSRAAFFTFFRQPGVEPTNNRAERSLRHSVLYRKSSLGTQSEQGSRYVERMLTTMHTLKAQHADVFSYLIDAASAALHHGSASPLVPALA